MATFRTHFIVQANDYLTLHLFGECENSRPKDVELELQAAFGEIYSNVVINCEHLSHLPLNWIRFLLQLKTQLATQNKLLRLLLAKSPLQSQLKKEGVDKVLVCSNSLRETLVEFGLLKKNAVDTGFINPFLSATLHVLKVQASVNATQGKLFLKTPKDTSVGDVSGVIGIVSETFAGTVVISFPEKTFLQVMSSMLGENYTSLSTDILDGASEITNMIFGQAKLVLNEKGYGIKRATPSVVSGKNHEDMPRPKGPTVVVPFESTAGDFSFEIGLTS